MYIIVDSKTNIIIGTAVNPVSTVACKKNGQIVYKIPDDKFNIDMIGSKLEHKDNIGNQND